MAPASIASAIIRSAKAGHYDEMKDALANDDIGPHPRMNAALIVMHARFLDLGRRDTAGRDEIARPELQAFRRRHGIAGQRIEEGDEAATEVVDFREGVRFAAGVPRLECLAVTKTNFARRKMPRARLFRMRQLPNERVQRDAALVTDAR